VTALPNVPGVEWRRIVDRSHERTALVEVVGNSIDVAFASKGLGATITLERRGARVLALVLIDAVQQIREEEQ
jgi:hypothetical protein